MDFLILILILAIFVILNGYVTRRIMIWCLQNPSSSSGVVGNDSLLMFLSRVLPPPSPRVSSVINTVKSGVDRFDSGIDFVFDLNSPTTNSSNVSSNPSFTTSSRPEDRGLVAMGNQVRSWTSQIGQKTIRSNSFRSKNKVPFSFEEDSKLESDPQNVSDIPIDKEVEDLITESN